MDCPREQEVLSAARVSGWRETCDDELRRHVEECETCSDLAFVVEIMRADHAYALQQPHLPGAAQVWWRAAVRVRADASEAAVRPLTWAHGIAGACAVGVSVAAIELAWPAMTPALEWTSALVSRLDANVAKEFVVALAQRSLPVVLTVAACLVLAPVALYFALSDE